MRPLYKRGELYTFISTIGLGFALESAILVIWGPVTHVVDRFHVVRWFASGLIEVRRRVQRIGEQGESPAFSPVIFRTRYLQLAQII